MATVRSVAARLARLFKGASIVILVVIATAAVTVLAGGNVTIASGPPALRIANTAIVVLLLAAACWVLREFSGLFAALRERRVFLSTNAARIRRVGWAVIAGEIARASAVCFESAYARDHFTVEGLRPESHFQINAFAIVCGLMILVLAEAFREETRLQDEASLTI